LVCEPVTAQEIVESAVTAFGERGRAPGCTLETRVAPGLRAFPGDKGALTTALLNLLDNAWKYSGEEKKIVISANAYEGGIRFSVTDNGVGIPIGEQRRVFDPFYQVDQRLARSASGCGLGLGIVRSIVEAHRGSVRVVSEPGQGSTFTMEIPTGKGTPS
jgi:two-component system phosphate regulon sensor histidine kinase PhoR